MSRLTTTFVTPHQNPASGGVYVIEQFARHLAPRMTVNLAVRSGPSVPIEGVNVFECEDLDHRQLPASDLLIVNADAEDAEVATTLPAQKGHPVLFLQGVGDFGAATIAANLARFDVAIAGSQWLVAAAARHDCRAVLVRFGLDREIFFPGPSAGVRPPSVAMMVHSQRGKGTQDGLAALDRVLEELPEARVRIFGRRKSISLHGLDDAERKGRFEVTAAPDRPAVGGLLRESAVFVCSSWEEGFGLPGLEAIACGASLATTDTKGSREYAFQGETALVTPPRRPDLLARSIVKLVRDSELRERIAARGAEYAERAYPEWPEAARRLREVLEELSQS